ncbi:MAG TPA: gluconate 2-dehydrogenase subunit 3 family protein [Gammaproteobacteria bacterium]|nr:gluconate 2-dehydrogenase subunit 3 family protein [Gammaproteobacteria bacterium]
MNDPLFNRRDFMRVLVTAAAAYPLSGLAALRSKNENNIPATLKEPWLTISVVQEHLFPAEKDSPGAKDIHALEYLQSMITAPDIEAEDRKLIHDGVGWLNDLSKQQYSKQFIELTEDDKEKILRRVEGSNAGSRWLSLLLTYLIEALLSDPVYAGNPKGIGWKWLNHQPGFPLPNKSKMYFKLGKPRYRNTKA